MPIIRSGSVINNAVLISRTPQVVVLKTFKLVNFYNNHNSWSPSSLDGILSSEPGHRRSLQDPDSLWVDVNIMVTLNLDENFFEAPICHWIKLAIHVHP